MKLGPDGKLKFLNLDRQVYVLADVVGYHTRASLQTLAELGAAPTIPSATTVTGSIVVSSHATANPFFDEFGIDGPGVAPAPRYGDDVNLPVGWFEVTRPARVRPSIRPPRREASASLPRTRGTAEPTARSRGSQPRSGHVDSGSVRVGRCLTGTVGDESVTGEVE